MLILGDINSFEQFNEINYNIFQLKTSTLLNLKCQENSPQYLINSNESTTNITPQRDQEKETEFNLYNLNQYKSSQQSQTPTKLFNTSTSQEQLTPSQISSFTKIHIDTECNCQTTQCIKKYCSCYANGNYCVPSICKCKSCINTFQNSLSQSTLKKQSSSQKSLSNENTIQCTCQKSFCKKQYCDCFKIGKKCSILCKCQNCCNQEENKIAQRLNFDQIPEFD